MGPIRILHVDDEPDIREVVQVSLGLDPDFSVRSCASGRDALAVTADWSPDLVLLDVMMPDMDGPTTLARLRERPATVEVPIVFMTARAQASDIEDFMSLGAAGVIAKPFDPMTLPSRARDYALRTSG
jgi:two-component system OmpR family response regulator